MAPRGFSFGQPVSGKATNTLKPKKGRRSRLECLEGRDMPATLTVNSLSDAFSPGAGEVTLRQAITASEYRTTTALNETGTGNDTIVFAPGLSGTIDLLGTLGSYNNDQLTIDGNNGGTGITIERDSSVADMQLFQVSADSSLTLESLTLSNGNVVGASGYDDTTYGGEGGGGAGLGGGIFNQGTLNLVRDTLTGNTAQGGLGGSTGNSFGAYSGAPGGGNNGGYGGGPGYGSPPGSGGSGGFASGGGGGGSADYSAPGAAGGRGGFGGGGGGGGSGTPNASGGAGGFGGGAGADSTGSATPGGGGAGMGGAVFNDAGTVTVTNCTFYGNSAIGGAAGGTGAFDGQGLGGAILNYNGTMTVLNSTFSGNSADNVGGIYNLADGATATLNLSNTILFGDTSPGTADLVAGASGAGGSTNATSGVGNLIGAESGFIGSIVSTSDPGLAALAANGGPTETMAIDATSPAVAAGDTTAAAGLATDQRGASRFTFGGVDIGAYQISVAPTANAGGQYQIHVGDSLTLNASASNDPGDIPLTYSWDINGDGVFSDATGVSPTLTWSQLNAIGITGTFSTANVAVEVSDGFFPPVASATTSLDVVQATVLTANERFITALYQLLLDRAPDAGGLAVWSSLLNGGLSRAQLALYIEQSSEYLAGEVNSAFERYLRRSADPAGLSMFVAMLGQGVTLEELDVAILSSEEYFETQGAGTNSGFLNALFQDSLGRPIDGPTSQFFGSLLSSGVSRGTIVLSVLTSAEHRQAIVNGMYQQYLHRPADPSGLNFALAKLERGESPAVLASEILGSAEYFEDVTSA
jgi:hypothetical protein